jgi:hypothetical protein
MRTDFMASVSRSALYKQYFTARTSHGKALKKALKSGNFKAEVKARRKMERLVERLKTTKGFQTKAKKRKK